MFVISCLFNAALLSPAGKGLTSWLSYVCLLCCVLSLFHVVSWVGVLYLIVSIPDLYPLFTLKSQVFENIMVN